jgi:hypothetical protein
VMAWTALGPSGYSGGLQTVVIQPVGRMNWLANFTL